MSEIVPVGRGFAESFVNDKAEEEAIRKCRNILWDIGRGELICADNGMIIADHVPSYRLRDNRVRASSSPIKKSVRGERRSGYIATHLDINPKIQSEILRMYEEGVKVKDIARKFGVSIGMVYDVVKSNTRLRRGSPRKYRRINQEEINEIIKELKEGMSLYRIAKKHGRSVGYLHWLIKKYGLDKLRKKKKEKEKRILH